MTPLTEFSEINHFLGPKVAAIDPCLIEISHCVYLTIIYECNVMILFISFNDF